MEKQFLPRSESLEVKDLGFNEPCFGFYLGGYKVCLFETTPWNERTNGRFITQFTEEDRHCTAPLHAQVFKWFRDEHKLKGEVVHSNANGSHKFTIWKWNFDNNVGLWERIGNIGTYDSHEEAQIMCIRKLIELIK
jgi:hypothetical protein